MSTDISPAKKFRQALGQFTTGVTVITTCDGEQRPVGITVNSFNSVSLEPQLVLWSLSNHTNSSEAFRQSDHFAIHVLNSGQQALSNTFATSNIDRFAGLSCRHGVKGSPILPDYLAVFQCQVKHRYQGGDHTIMVGEVLDFDMREDEPLVFHGGAYTKLAASA